MDIKEKRIVNKVSQYWWNDRKTTAINLLKKNYKPGMIYHVAVRLEYIGKPVAHVLDFVHVAEMNLMK